MLPGLPSTARAMAEAVNCSKGSFVRAGCAMNMKDDAALPTRPTMTRNGQSIR